MFAFIQPLSGEHPGHDLPGQPGRIERPDNSLPSLPNYPDNGLPEGGTINLPSHPIVIPPPPAVNKPVPPGSGEKPDNSLPPVVWPGVPVHPATPSHPIALPPGTIWPPLSPAAGNGKALALVLIPGVGSRWVVLDLTGKVPQPK